MSVTREVSWCGIGVRLMLMVGLVSVYVGVVSWVLLIMFEAGSSRNVLQASGHCSPDERQCVDGKFKVGLLVDVGVPREQVGVGHRKRPRKATRACLRRGGWVGVSRCLSAKVRPVAGTSGGGR